VAKVEATNPESSPRSKGKQVENCIDGMVADAESATARAESATARAIRQEMGKPAPDLAVLRAHLKTLEQDSNPNAETKGLTDALRDFIQLAAQRKAR
jgi:hypothetical protein